MTKRGSRRQKSQSQVEEPFDTSGAYEWIPVWGWVLIFLLPLLLSEFMFWNARRTASMVLFPVAWVGFWYVMMQRAGWPMLKGRKNQEDSSTGDGNE